MIFFTRKYVSPQYNLYKWTEIERNQKLYQIHKIHISPNWSYALYSHLNSLFRKNFFFQKNEKICNLNAENVSECPLQVIYVSFRSNWGSKWGVF